MLISGKLPASHGINRWLSVRLGAAARTRTTLSASACAFTLRSAGRALLRQCVSTSTGITGPSGLRPHTYLKPTLIFLGPSEPIVELSTPPLI